MPTRKITAFVLAGTALALILANAIVRTTALPGAFSHHMLQHILLMNLAAPVLALVLQRHLSASLGGLSLFASGAMQLVLLLTWHAPPVMQWVMASTSAALAMQLTLFVAALAFWLSVFSQAGIHLWRALAALLLTGKIYCLLAALLVFAPRALYAAGGAAGESALADQQLAGTLMVVACPLSYIVVAVVITARWLGELHRRGALSMAPGHGGR